MRSPLTLTCMLSPALAWNDGKKPSKDACAQWCRFDQSNCVAAFKKDQCAGCDLCKQMAMEKALEGCDACTPLCCQRIANVSKDRVEAHDETAEAACRRDQHTEAARLQETLVTLERLRTELRAAQTRLEEQQYEREALQQEREALRMSRDSCRAALRRSPPPSAGPTDSEPPSLRLPPCSPAPALLNPIAEEGTAASGDLDDLGALVGVCLLLGVLSGVAYRACGKAGRGEGEERQRKRRSRSLARQEESVAKGRTEADRRGRITDGNQALLANPQWEDDET